MYCCNSFIIFILFYLKGRQKKRDKQVTEITYPLVYSLNVHDSLTQSDQSQEAEVQSRFPMWVAEAQFQGLPPAACEDTHQQNWKHEEGWCLEPGIAVQNAGILSSMLTITSSNHPQYIAVFIKSEDVKIGRSFATPLVLQHVAIECVSHLNLELLMNGQTSCKSFGPKALILPTVRFLDELPCFRHMCVASLLWSCQSVQSHLGYSVLPVQLVS